MRQKYYMEYFDPRVERVPCKSCSWQITGDYNQKGQEKKIIKFWSSLPRKPFSCIKFWKPINQALRKTRLCLNTNFDSFERTESHISKYLSRCTAEKEYETLVTIIYQHIRVKLLKVFIETKFAAALNAISKKFARPTSPKWRRSLFSPKGWQPWRNAIILDWIHLRNNKAKQIKKS